MPSAENSTPICAVDTPLFVAETIETRAGKLKQFLAGRVGGMEFTQGVLLAIGVLMEIPMAMVLLSRLLKYRTNRVANLGAGVP